MSEVERTQSELEGSTKKSIQFEVPVSSLSFPYTNGMIGQVFFTNEMGVLTLDNLRLSRDITWGIFCHVIQKEVTEVRKGRKVVNIQYSSSQLKLSPKAISLVEKIYSTEKSLSSSEFTHNAPYGGI